MLNLMRVQVSVVQQFAQHCPMANCQLSVSRPQNRADENPSPYHVLWNSYQAVLSFLLRFDDIKNNICQTNVQPQNSHTYVLIATLVLLETSQTNSHELTIELLVLLSKKQSLSERSNLLIQTHKYTHWYCSAQNDSTCSKCLSNWTVEQHTDRL